MTGTTAPSAPAPSVPKLPTGIPGFDLVAQGGLPRGRSTLVAGTAGSGKTVFAAHFLAAGITEFGEPGVFVTFEDLPADIRRNVQAFGWDIEAWERDGRWAFVDVSPPVDGPVPVVGEYDLSGMLARVERAIERTGARRVVLDSLNALYLQFPDRSLLRSELYRVAAALKARGTTMVFTGERTDDYGALTPFGVEEFVADNVIVLRNILANERRRRTMEILKFRGTTHQRGEVPFTIRESGLVVIPLTAQRLTQTSTSKRVPSGDPELDAMCGGGFFRDSIILVSGATGTGKTLLAAEFLAGGARAGERCLLFAFEESQDQLYRNAAAWGMDFAALEKAGRLRIVNQYPHAMPLEDHFVRMRDAIDEFKPDRVAVDSLSAIERVFTLRSYREFVIGFTSLLKSRSVTGFFTSTAPTLAGGASVTEKHISTLTDTIILLRYVERRGELRRSLMVLKMRGSEHDHEIREYTIDGAGMHLGEPMRDVSGIIAGHAVHDDGGRDRGDEADGDEETGSA
jgi:circadian clock protein KaiC